MNRGERDSCVSQPAQGSFRRQTPPSPSFQPICYLPLPHPVSLSGILSPAPLSAQLLGSPQNVVGTDLGVPWNVGSPQNMAGTDPGVTSECGVPPECGRMHFGQLYGNQIPILTMTSCVSVGKLLRFSVPWVKDNTEFAIPGNRLPHKQRKQVS